MKFELIATTTSGLEAVVKRELQALGFDIIKVEDGKVTYSADERGIVRSNLWLRTTGRVLIKMSEFKAYEFEDLFVNIKKIPWEKWIPKDGNFKVDCSSVRSKLFSMRSCQSVGEKAIIERLKSVHRIDRFSKEKGLYIIKISLMKDVAVITLDTSGEGLHKRGYRKNAVAAPIKETLASALVQLSFWKEGRLLVDPCCGSGTIPIEAALIGRNIAPGLNRTFAAEGWSFISADMWKEERKKAFGEIKYDSDIRIEAYDIDPKSLEAAEENAAEAGVEDCITFKRMDMQNLTASEKSGVIVTNPPYGERIGEKETIKKIYKKYASFFEENPTWSLFIISPDKKLENAIFGKPADRRRKLYNGNIETCYYQFHGQKEPR